MQEAPSPIHRKPPSATSKRPLLPTVSCFLSVFVLCWYSWLCSWLCLFCALCRSCRRQVLCGLFRFAAVAASSVAHTNGGQRGHCHWCATHDGMHTHMLTRTHAQASTGSRWCTARSPTFRATRRCVVRLSVFTLSTHTVSRQRAVRWAPWLR